ncbi:MAG: tetraacyldisaccharide 4'-kinase [Caulobacter sp.]|nr:tetraacyldisaccharide 4'-kinase [Caulobacter sp.]
MKLSTPRWWYVRHGAPRRVTRTLLRPLSWLWAAVTARRIARTVPVDAGLPVICVGNLTVGGTGKTPVVRELLRLLTARDRAAHGLSRGYGGRLEGPLRVDPAVHTAADVGDEPLMLARDYPVWISADRPAGARAARAGGAQVLVMDDGHQNPSLKKALSLVVVDGETRNNEWPFGDGAVFPAGPMREPIRAGLARTDAVILLLPADMAEPDPDLVALFGKTPVLVARFEPAAAPPSGPQIGFAGIGKPWKVERALEAAGCDLKDFVRFPDHHAYTAADLALLEDLASRHGAGLVTTEKDWVRLPPAWRAKATAWPVRARFEDEASLLKILPGA